jgi:glycosyltransferase involved in cell wall biosynthesis
VLIFVQNLPVPLDRRVWQECRALRAAGYEVSVVCPEGPGDPAYQVLEGVHIYKYRPAPPATGPLAYAWEFVYCLGRAGVLAARAHRRRPLDAVQACNPPDTYWALALLFRLVGARFVYDQHDLCPEVYESRFERPSRLLLAVLRGLEQATYRTAHRVISTNDSYREVALGRGRRRPEDVTVVRSGPDLDIMRRAEPRPELRHGRRHLMCYLGIMGPQDGVDLALRAVAKVVHEHGRDDVHTTFMGFGDCYDELVALAHELGLDDHVDFTGRADMPMIIDRLSTADLGLCPDPKSPLNDVSTMNKTLEYMAFGVPLVSFDLKEQRISAGDAGVFVPSPDVDAFAAAVVALLDDPARRAVMGERGRQRIVDEMGWTHQAARYVGVYDDLLGVVRPALAPADAERVDEEPAKLSA